MKLIYFYRFIYNEEYAYLCVGNNNTPLSPKIGFMHILHRLGIGYYYL